MKSVSLFELTTALLLVVSSIHGVAKACDGDDVLTKRLPEVSLWEAKAKSGDAQAQAVIGLAYLTGRGVSKDIDYGLSLLNKSAAAGNSDGQYLLGQFLAVSGKSDADFERAFSLLKRSADQNCAPALFYLSGLTTVGKGTAKNPDKGFQLLTQAAEAGYPTAQFALGVQLMSGSGAEKNIGAGFSWIQRAADAGDSAAAIAVAAAHLDGTGTSKDPGKTIKILEDVYNKKDQQSATAADYLGWMYMEGRGVHQDNVKAFHWLSISANANNNDAKARIKSLIDKLPSGRLATSCNIYMHPDLSGNAFRKLDENESFVIVSDSVDTSRDVAEVFFKDISVEAFISRKCMSKN